MAIRSENINMKSSLLVTLLLFVASGCSPQAQSTWKPLLDGGHHIGTGGASILAFGYSDHTERSIVFFFPFDINSGSDHTSNAKLQTFDYSGTVTVSPGKEPVLSYHIASSDVATITCNETDYELRKGSVFYVAHDGTITQLPFAGLQPTKDYVSDLQEYFGSKPEKAVETKE